MIANSAQRASLVPHLPRLSIYISKTNFSHDQIYGTGALCIHMLRTDQWDLIWHLGLQSARDIDKLASVKHSVGKSGLPVIEDCLTAYECRVINAMDAGASTFFLADVMATHHLSKGEVMTSDYFRTHITEDRKRDYEERLIAAIPHLSELASVVDSGKVWTGPSAAV